MTRCKWSFIMVVGLLGFTLGCGVVIRNATPPPAPCPIEELLIDENVVPDEWWLYSTGDPATRFGVEFEEISFNSSNGRMLYDVYREWSVRKAQDSYRDLAKSYFSLQNNLTAWDLPPELTYQSSVADQVQIGCAMAISSQSQRCQFVAQYDVYVVWFHASMSEVMTYTDFEAVLQNIDERMATCLK
ncbi:MAG: hypothetical protein JXA33_21150 [Anaerolineae bacterium]|nr:hypothetical protein [Anaerolineae bacterium]